MIPQPTVPPPSTHLHCIRPRPPLHEVYADARVRVRHTGVATQCSNSMWWQPSPSLDRFPTNVAAEPHIGPPQAGSRPAAPPHCLSRHGCTWGKACPPGWSSPYVLATVSPSWAPQATWAALAHSTRNNLPTNVGGSSGKSPPQRQVHTDTALRRRPHSSVCSRRKQSLAMRRDLFTGSILLFVYCLSFIYYYLL
jgi:hypothetical protein